MPLPDPNDPRSYPDNPDDLDSVPNAQPTPEAVEKTKTNAIRAAFAYAPKGVAEDARAQLAALVAENKRLAEEVAALQSRLASGEKDDTVILDGETARAVTKFLLGIETQVAWVRNGLAVTRGDKRLVLASLNRPDIQRILAELNSEIPNGKA